MNIWQYVGYNMLFFLAGLQTIPPQLYEAAGIDGASAWGKFRRITLPLLNSTMLFVLVTDVIGSFQVFDQVYVLTQGGPMNSTFTGLYYAYDQGLKHLKLPRALAASFVVSIFCVGIALLCLRYIRPRHR